MQEKVELVGGPLDGGIFLVYVYCGCLWTPDRWPLSHRYDDTGRRNARGMRVFVYVGTMGSKQCPK